MKTIALVLAISLGGCSPFVTSARPSPAADGRLVCHRASLPALELLVALFAGWAVAGRAYDGEFGTTGVIVTGTAVVFGAAGFAGTLRLERCDELRAAASERARVLAESERSRREALERARAQAWAITQQAATSARSGDCQPSRDASARVSQLDAEFHAQVFLRDAAIGRCLQPSGEP